MTLRLAVWSGPRNISTAMMRAWENRDDCEVLDEPFYAYYLRKTGLDHPAADKVMASQSTDWREVAALCQGEAPNQAAIFYQKQMSFHVLDEVDRGWMSDLTHCFLIRDPESVVASYAQVRDTPTLADIGFVQQSELYHYVCQYLEPTPVVIDSAEFLANPEAMLRAWCEALGIEFSERMLTWPAGPRDSDGVWAPHWYASVWASTGFAKRRVTQPALNPRLRALADQARPYYQDLYDRRLRVL